jgi:HEAT repeat protein
MDHNTPASPKGILSKLAQTRARSLGLLLLLIMAAAALWFFSREPAYQGKPASYWLDHMDSDADKTAAVGAFQAMGRPGVLFLVRIIKERPAQMGESLFEKLADSHLPMPDSLRNALARRPRSKDRRDHALFVLGKLGPIAEVALPELMRLFNAAASSDQVADDYGVVEALDALGDKKAAYTPDFVRAFQQCRWEPNASMAARLLASIGPKAKAAIPVLLEYLPTGSDVLSNAIADALWKIDRQTNTVLQILTNNLRSLANERQITTLGELRGMGLAAKPAAPLVLHSILTCTERARTAAAETLQEIDPALYRSTMDDLNQHAAARIQSLIESIRDGGPQRMPALEAIALYGPEAKPAVPALIDVLQECRARTTNGTKEIAIDRSGFIVGLAADALAEIGPEAHEAVSALASSLPERVLKGSTKTLSSYEVTSPCRALGMIGPQAAAAAPVLQALLQNQNLVFRAAAAAALARIAPEQKDRLVDILRSLANSNPLLNKSQVVLPAKVALWRLGAEKEPPVQELIAALAGGSPYDTVQLLGDIGPPARSALPQLKRFLGSNKDINFRHRTAIAIRKIDPKAAADLDLPGFMVLP